MAKKRRRRRASLLTKAINVGVLLLAFARPLQLAMSGDTNAIIRGASFGMVNPGQASGTSPFNKAEAISFYGPMVAAIVLKKAISMVRKTVRI